MDFNWDYFQNETDFTCECINQWLTNLSPSSKEQDDKLVTLTRKVTWNFLNVIEAERAVGILNVLLDIVPENSWLLMNRLDLYSELAGVLQDKRFLEKALEDCRIGLKIKNNKGIDFDSRYFSLNLELGNFDEAICNFHRCKEPIERSLAEAYILAGDFKPAIDIYTSDIEKVKHTAPEESLWALYARRGYLFHLTGDTEKRDQD